MGDTNYIIPYKQRKIENLHVVFWLLKDLSWCLVFKPLGISMIFPTLAISIWITYKHWKDLVERCHNLAITAWIISNAYWMTSEFLKFDNKIIFGAITFKELTLIPFTIGVVSLGYYYIWECLIKKQFK